MKKEEIENILRQANVKFNFPIKDGMYLYVEEQLNDTSNRFWGFYYIYSSKGHFLDLQSSLTVVKPEPNIHPSKRKNKKPQVRNLHKVSIDKDAQKSRIQDFLNKKKC